MLQNSESKSAQLSLALSPERKIFRVSELNAELQGLFDRQFTRIWVSGEIAGCKLSGNGHFYFVLKDRDAQVKCVVFKSTARYAKVRPQDGIEVVARGNLEVYAARGDYQLIVEALEPQGAGALQLAFDQLKKKLGAEGLFESARKRPLPRLPRRIGLVTSQSGAVLRDILHILERRFPGLHIRLFPTQVQGEGSVEQICAGLRHFNQDWAEVVVVARGGGSLEDLWTFNEEAVARAVVASRVPVISAIGHETDFTICDFVADLRAPTPSAAAELVICTRDSLLEQLNGCRAKMLQTLRLRVMTDYRRLESLGAERGTRILSRLLAHRMQQLDETDARLRRRLDSQVLAMQQRLNQLDRRLHQSDLRLRIARNQHRRHQLDDRLLQWPKSLDPIYLRLQGLKRSVVHAATEKTARSTIRMSHAYAHLTQLSPLAVLRRGYAIVKRPDGRAVRAASEISLGESLRVRLGEGGLQVTVNSYTEE